ncbi:MAG: FAD:protein FMN transferase [Planctomycetes bacterium]|nr:FAD:protein FMN transferase [Planctomycetota bacterium]
MNKTKNWIIYIIVALIVLTGIAIVHKKASSLVDVDSGQRVIMGTFVRIIAVADSESTARKSIDAAFEKFKMVDDLMSTYKPQSEISAVNNNAFKAPVKISPPFMDVLLKSIEYSKLTAGAFDVTVGPMVKLWREAEKADKLPTALQINQTKAKVGYEKLIIDPNNMTVKFKAEAMQLDLGAIAKGYAIDQAIEAMQAAGAVGAMVDAGGDIMCWGKPQPGKDKWMVGLQDPTKVDQVGLATSVMLVLKLDNMAVATSGDYQRFEMIEGKKYSHIIDRNKGAASEGLSSVTVICEKAVDADALATSVSVLGVEKGLKLIESLDSTEAILIESAGSELIKSSGVDKIILESLTKDNQMHKTYQVQKASLKPEIKGLWDGSVWKNVTPIKINNHMGTAPQHKPDTQAKLLYDEENLYVIFKVEDNYILATAEKYQDSVCQDSCVEFFFTPSQDTKTGYFNIETNCGGTMLFRHQLTRGVDENPVTEEDFSEMQIYHSEDKIIIPQRNTPTNWTVEYKLPFDFLSKYSRIDKPKAGVKWRANFYKCADATSKPHWLTWSVVDRPKPDFHHPEFFGTLEFL